MRFPFAKTIDYQVESQFRKDPAGRLVFFPFGVKEQGYFVDSKTDEEKIRVYLRKYRGTALLISLLVSPSIYIPALLLDLYGGAGSVRHRVTTVIELSVFVMLFLLTLSWARWVAYKQAVGSFTTTLSEIGLESKLGLSEVSDRPQMRRLVLAGLACLILGAAALIGATRYSRSKVVCPPNAASSSQ
ncbi:MAG: hypothetical protein WBQ09_01875 [Terriglobales bacterium]|jgi:hypothetical protein